MDKAKLVEFLAEKITKDLIILRDAAKATYEAATHEESKPENEYDTRGLEASYLAGAQSKRVGEIEEVLSSLKYAEIRNFKDSDSIAATALVEVKLKQKRLFLFVMPKGGGISFQFDGHDIQIVTPNSPLGEALVGMQVGDTAVVERGAQTLEYEIVSLQ